MSPILVLLAATAKIYPVFALPAFVIAAAGSRRASRLLCMAAFGVYFAVQSSRHRARR